MVKHLQWCPAAIESGPHGRAKTGQLAAMSKRRSSPPKSRLADYLGPSWISSRTRSRPGAGEVPECDAHNKLSEELIDLIVVAAT